MTDLQRAPAAALFAIALLLAAGFAGYLLDLFDSHDAPPGRTP